MITDKDLQEVFRSPAVREVACEIRFAPRLRIIPEVWRIQDSLAELYPQVGEEQIPQADGRILQVYVFSNPLAQRVVKVSQENFLVAFNSYSTFEDFKSEAIVRAEQFSREFDVRSYQRTGLRYINHIELRAADALARLRTYVNAPIDFERFDPETIEQFLTEFRLKAGKHKLTVRGALIQVPGKMQELLYILDLDCYSSGTQDAASLPNLIDEFHRQIQIQFLEQVRESYKEIMRK